MPTPEQACARYALAAVTVDTGAGQTLTTVRHSALSAYASPRLQARLDPAVTPEPDPPTGRSPRLPDARPPDEQEQQWRQHHARTTPEVRTDTTGRDDTYPTTDRVGRAERSVLVAGTATGTDGWTGRIAPYRLDCLLTRNPAAGGWLVDDLAVTPTSEAAASSPAVPYDPAAAR